MLRREPAEETIAKPNLDEVSQTPGGAERETRKAAAAEGCRVSTGREQNLDGMSTTPRWRVCNLLGPIEMREQAARQT